MNIEKLDNPTWYALTETHKNFAIDYNGAKFYQPDCCPFGGFIDHYTAKKAVNNYALLTDNFYVIGNKPFFNGNVLIKRELVCNQMLLDKQIDLLITENITALETTQQKADLIELINLVQPGYFKEKTPNLGNYYGIYKNDKLVAVTGERMKMDKYTEVSAVVTHHEHIGKGYAKQLVTFVSNKIFNENKIPFLHVADINTGAIRLYERLGFHTRRKISFWNFVATKLN
jgi:GNAT superfamily N-acetyltransferase